MEPLDKSTVIRAGQRPALPLYVPINVLLAECMVGLVLFRVIGMWALAFLPLHLWFVIKTADDVNWVKVSWANFKFTVFNFPSVVSNKHLHGKGVISFTASPIKAATENYVDLRH